MIEDAKKDNSFTPLIRKIGQIFSDSDSLKRSFLRTEDTKEHLAQGETFYSLDVTAVRTAYNLILDLKREEINNILIAANGRLVAQLKLEARRFNNPEDLRQFVILYENPLLNDPGTHKEILGPLLAATVNLPASSQMKLQNWFSGYTSEQFRRLVGLIQQFITLYILTANPIVINRETQITSATKVLGLLRILFY